MADTAIRVECYAGYKADERPLRFVLRGRQFEILQVEDRWYSPGTTYFRVHADDGNFYVLRHEEGMDSWTLDAFRSSHVSSAAAEHCDPTAHCGPHGAS